MSLKFHFIYVFILTLVVMIVVEHRVLLAELSVCSLRRMRRKSLQNVFEEWKGRSAV